MRAGRILNMLLTLQRRGRMTAGELAELLEVSERTVLRDVEALGEAGVPIFTVQGVGGGIELMDGFETRLTGLTVDEARSLLLIGQPDVATLLGRGAATRSARRKLNEALSPRMRNEANALASWFLHDPWATTSVALSARELRRVVSCIHRRRRIELTIGRRRPMLVAPLGVVLRAGAWYLVAIRDDTIGHFRIDDLRSTRITRHAFDAPQGFVLEDYWRRVAR